MDDLERKLKWLCEIGQGVLYCRPSGFHFVVVDKFQTFIRLGYSDRSLKTQYVQSILDLQNPLKLISPSSRTFLLGLIWKKRPRRVYIAGFGAGRFPAVLGHHFPDVAIECTDIEPALPEVSELFFGVELGDRIRFTLQDGRTYLESREPKKQYDLIVIDVALGNGYTPYRLATREFFQLCKERLSEGGAIACNYLPHDPFIPAKLETLRQVFPSVYASRTSGANTVAFAFDPHPASGEELPLSPADFVREARQIETTHSLSDSLSELAQTLREVEPSGDRPEPLRDDTPPPDYFRTLGDLKPLSDRRVGNHFCPCGSGRLFAECHGGNPA